MVARILGGLLLLSFFIGLAHSTYAAVELVPNLKAAPATDVRSERRGSQTFLRFTTMGWNNGTGPLEVVAGDTAPTGQQNVYQRIYANDGSYRDILAGFFMWHPTHNHVHFENYASYILEPLDPNNHVVGYDTKTTFCIMDTSRINTRLPGAPQNAVYTTCAADKQGMSVGWGDTYKYYLDGQEMDITGFPNGDYRLTIRLDPDNRLLELDDSDNTSSVTVRLQSGKARVISNTRRNGITSPAIER